MSITLNIDTGSIPEKEWKWDEDTEGYTSVRIKGNRLLWSIKKHSNASDKITEQSFDDYMRQGPVFDTIPADAMVDLYEIIIDAIR